MKGSHRLYPFTWSCSGFMMSGTDTITVATWTVHLSAKLCFASSGSTTPNLLLPTRRGVDCPSHRPHPRSAADLLRVLKLARSEAAGARLDIGNTRLGVPVVAKCAECRGTCPYDLYKCSTLACVTWMHASCKVRQCPHYLLELDCERPAAGPVDWQCTECTIVLSPTPACARATGSPRGRSNLCGHNFCEFEPCCVSEPSLTRVFAPFPFVHPLPRLLTNVEMRRMPRMWPRVNSVTEVLYWISQHSYTDATTQHSTTTVTVVHERRSNPAPTSYVNCSTTIGHAMCMIESGPAAAATVLQALAPVSPLDETTVSPPAATVTAVHECKSNPVPTSYVNCSTTIGHAMCNNDRPVCQADPPAPAPAVGILQRPGQENADDDRCTVVQPSKRFRPDVQRFAPTLRDHADAGITESMAVDAANHRPHPKPRPKRTRRCDHRWRRQVNQRNGLRYDPDPTVSDTVRESHHAAPCNLQSGSSGMKLQGHIGWPHA